MEAFRARMRELNSKALYRRRGEAAEWVNACARRHGLYMLRVRGSRKVHAVLVLFALAHNLQRVAKLRPERAAATELGEYKGIWATRKGRIKRTRPSQEGQQGGARKWNRPIDTR